MPELAPYWKYWGKARPDEHQTPIWHPFAHHSLDVAAVAASLWDRSQAVRGAFGTALGAAEAELDCIRGWVLFFVALHDIGKLHAWFQCLSPEAMTLAWPELSSDSIAKKRGAESRYEHGPEGYRLIKQYLSQLTTGDDGGWRKMWRRWRPWAAAVTGHHGEIPGDADEGPPHRGYAESWVQEWDTTAQRGWVKQAAALFLEPAGIVLSDSPPPCEDPARTVLAGFCSLCDWIGSNTNYFPYREFLDSEDKYLADRTREIEERNLLRELGLLAPVKDYAGVPALLRRRESPRGSQVLVDGLPLGPTLTLIEAPTGSGKTEAALAHAWRLLATGAVDSVVFALPTQATANAMLARAELFAGLAYGKANLVLAHGNSRINAEYRRLVDAGRQPSAQGAEEAAVQCAGWLASSRKRVFLGQVGVCTVDQTLLSVLPVRHSFVRGFGLSRSVLIVDEVHAYDAYMHGLLGEVLRRQRATGGSAILLSATLPSAVRAELLGAWGAQPERTAPYPAVWSVHSGAARAMVLPDSEGPEPRSVHTEHLVLPDAFPDAAIIERMVAACRAGALVGVVMNTVDAAQGLARLLCADPDVSVDLFHARYRLKDRQAIERRVIERYGRDAERSSGRILVATQVIEQSLDLDFDWLLTQICPVDLLFQRIGRLHRHSRTRPSGFESPFCSVLCPNGNDYGVFELIYGDPRPLWRTERLIAKRGTIEFPEAYRNWIESVYAEDAWDDEPDGVIGKHHAYRDDSRDAATRARRLTTMSIRQFRDDDERATSLTRDGEMSLTVLPILASGALLDGEALSSLDEYELAESLLLASVPAPRSWEKLLAGLERDEDGRIRLPMSDRARDMWISQDRNLRYSEDLGLEKLVAPGPLDRAPQNPR